MSKVTERVKRERRETLLGSVVFWVAGLIVITGAVAFLGVAWYVGVIVGVLFSFAVLWLEGEAEDEVLVEAYGPFKKSN